MQLTLNTWQRITLLQVVNGVKGDLRTVRKALRAIDVLELSAEDRETVGLAEHPNGAVTWTDSVHRFELEVPDELVAWLREQVEAKADWPVSPNVIDLCERLGVKGDA